MGVYIDMEMPKEIEPALVIDFCEDLDGKRYARFYHYRYEGLTDWHEVLELHEPHGRLIDADALMDDISASIVFSGRGYNPAVVGASKVVERIETAPTIIPASEEGQ